MYLQSKYNCLQWAIFVVSATWVEKCERTHTVSVSSAVLKPYTWLHATVCVCGSRGGKFSTLSLSSLRFALTDMKIYVFLNDELVNDVLSYFKVTAPGHRCVYIFLNSLTLSASWCYRTMSVHQDHEGLTQLIDAICYPLVQLEMLMLRWYVVNSGLVNTRPCMTSRLLFFFIIA